MAIEGLYVNTPLADLQSMRIDALALLQDIRRAHQSYAIAGRNVNRAPLVTAQKDLAEIDYAISRASGGIIRTSVPDMSVGNGC